MLQVQGGDVSGLFWRLQLDVGGVEVIGHDRVGLRHARVNVKIQLVDDNVIGASRLVFVFVDGKRKRALVHDRGSVTEPRIVKNLVRFVGLRGIGKRIPAVVIVYIPG